MSYAFEKTSLGDSLTITSSTFGGLPRSIDFIFAGIGLVLLSPVFLVCSILVRLSSPGSILYAQQRLGINGELFTLYKFRSMVTDKTGSLVTASNDHRITKIGKFLRMYKLDELPELYNVFRGDMAFVGARPEVPEMVDLSDIKWQQVLQIRPGITDPVTLRLRNEEKVLAQATEKDSFYREVLQPYKLNGYLKYAETRTWKSDIRIIFRTIEVIILPQPSPDSTFEEVALSSIGASKQD